MTDPDMGPWVYAYDPIGTLQYQRDAKGQYVYFSYDALKRLVRKWYPVAWTQPTITAGSSQPTVHDLMELRAAVDVNRRAAGLSASTWADASIIAGMGIKVRAAHFTELRDRIQDLWTAAGLGTIPEFTGGAIVADTRTIKASDLTDLRGWLVTYEYSTVGQVLRARVYLEYDAWDGSTQFGIGRRTALWDACGRQSVWWDKAGRTTKQERTIDGTVYTTQWSYDALDRVYQMSYPDNEVLTYDYAANGLLSQISSSLYATLLSGTQYNALNLPTGYTLGSGTTAQVSHTYYGPDATGSPYGALKTIQLQQGANPKLVNRDIGYDAVGNVASVNDLANTELISYQYDEQDRLTTASAPVNESFAYNAIGNLVTKNGLGYTYGDSAHKHAVTAYNGVSYAYDANGAMISRGAQAISYDTESRPVKVDAGGSTLCRFAYDGDGGRRKRLDSQGTIHYVGPYERNVGNGINTTEVVIKYYVARFGPVSRLIAIRRAGVLYWVGTDHLGSTVRVADANFSAVDGMRYLPFGGSRDQGASLNTDHKFTSQIEDQSVGLYWYASRAYDPAIGRFVSPDSMVPEPTNPQALNRYSYTYNEPLGYPDPTGHDPNNQALSVTPTATPIPPTPTSTPPPTPTPTPHPLPTPSPGPAPGHGAGPTSPWNIRGFLGNTARWLGDQAYRQFEGRWNLVNNVYGASLGTTSVLFGGSPPRDQEQGNIIIYENLQGPALWLVKNMFGGGQDNALTIGHVMLFSRAPNMSNPREQWWYAHERAHVRQADILGLWYLPAYVQGLGPSTINALLHWDYRLAHDSHWMETGANEDANRQVPGVMP